MSYKNFKSKFVLLAEEETSRYRQGGYLMGDFAIINKKALNHPEIKNKPSNFIDVVKELINSDLPLKISAVKSERPESQHDLYGAGSLMTKIYIDLYQEYAPGLFKNAITLPAEVVDVVKPEGNNWSPAHPETWKYDNKEEINGKPVKDAEGDLEHQTQGSKRKTATKDTKGITKGTAKGAKVQKPVEYKESVEKNDTDLLAEAYDNVTDEEYTRNQDRSRETSDTTAFDVEPAQEVAPDIEDDDLKEDIFEKYGTYAKQFDGLNTKAAQKELTPAEKKFYHTFQALLEGEASVEEMKLAHKHWMEEDELSEADKVRNAYLNVQAKKI